MTPVARRHPETGALLLRLPVREQQLEFLSAVREHLHERMNRLEEHVFGRASRRKVPRSWARWTWYMHRRLSAVERLEPEKVELDADSLAARIMRPENARALVRLLLAAPAG